MASYTPAGTWSTAADSAQAGILNRIASEIARTNGPLTNFIGCPLASGDCFYNQYRWCLDACPVLGEVLNHLSEELAKLDQSQGGWQESEVIHQHFSSSHAASRDTLDDIFLQHL